MLEVSSRISGALVGRSYAEVTRVVTIPGEVLKKAKGGLCLRGLPLGMDDASVRAWSKQVGFSVRRLRVALSANDQGVGETPSEQAVRGARLAWEAKQQSLERLRREIADIDAVTLPQRPAGTKSGGPPPSPVLARLELLDFLGQRKESLRAEFKRLNRGDEYERLRDLEDALRRASSARETRPDELKKALGFDIESTAEGELEFFVSYRIRSARWTPEYTLRMNVPGAEGAHELEMRALVEQNTGEDWNGVELVLSTAHADSWSDLPELHSQKIGRKQLRPRKRGYRPLPEGVDALYQDFDRANVEPEVDLERGGGTPAVRLPGSSRPIPIPAAPPPPPPLGGPNFEAGAGSSGGGYGSPPAFSAPATPIAALARSVPRGAIPAPQALPGGFGGAPPIQQGLPQPSSATRTGSVRKSSSRDEGAIGGEVDALFALSAMDSSSLREADHTAEEIDLNNDSRLFDYPSFRMGGASDPQRGELTPLGQAEMYREASVGLSIRFDLQRALEGSFDPAIRMSQKSVPPGHTVPRGLDGFDYAFACAAVADIPSDGQPHSISVTRGTPPMRQFHLAVPRESRDVFRVATFENPFTGPLLAGPLDVYDGPDFLLTTDVPVTPSKGKILLGFGVDQAVKLVRNTRYEESVVGLMRGALELAHHVSIEATNHRRTPIELEVRERAPTVRDKEQDIKVEITAMDPRSSPYEQDGPELLGGFVWKLSVPSGEKRTMSFSYTIRIASKHELVGGNRREE